MVKEPRSSSLSPPDETRDGISQSSEDSDPATIDVVPDVPPSQALSKSLSEPPLSETNDPTRTHGGPGALPSAASSRAPRSVPSVPRVGIPRALRGWDRYEVLSVLGAGGMGAVYRARDPRLNRFVALKIVHPRLGHSTAGSEGQSYVRRFEREARLQASLDHPHICKVYEIGELPNTGDDEEAGYPYIAMQLIGGKPLHRIAGDMSLFEKVRVIQQVAEALHAAHRQGLVHRDIKPSNIMVERAEDGKYHPYVMDFGLARETAGTDQSRSGLIEGTPRYMSPEQARGETRNVDRRTDVYALGVTLYEMLVGRSPYEGSGEMDILLAVITAEPKPLRAISANIPEDLEAITLKCLEKESAARYDSAKALAEDLGRYLDGEPVRARRIGLTQRLYRRARKHKPLLGLGAALLLSLAALVGYGVRTRLATLAVERQAREQAELAQRLGQEITKMEWLLRSARQMPLHDLGREKGIIRKRMEKLQAEIASYGERGRGLAHYALGRGHLALHEYPEAMKELNEAMKEGNSSAEVQYAVGLVMGKHFEKEMYEARLSGGGDWARKQRKKLEEKYLSVAVEALKKSREKRTEAPGYLEAVIAYYQKDYEGAERKVKEAEEEAPWMYEAGKLSGDIHLEKALQARDGGKYEEAEKEFGEAVRRYKEAAAIGQSDGEVYEGLAEAWVRQIEMAATRGKPTQEAYVAAVEASDKVTVSEPGSVQGKLKKAFAALMTMAVTGAGTSSAEIVKQCLDQAAAVLHKDPENPYARDVAANCSTFAADAAIGRGENPEPLFQRAFSFLEPAVRRYPYFLWGHNDLASAYLAFGVYLQVHGSPKARSVLEKSLQYEDAALSLDGSYLVALQNSLFAWSALISVSDSEAEIANVISRMDKLYSDCMKINSSFQQCNINYFIGYSRAAQRLYLAGLDPRSYAKRAQGILSLIHKLGGSFLDVEQHTALLYLTSALDQVRRDQDPSSSLLVMQGALDRCFAINTKDAMCRTMAAEGEWVEGEWEEEQGRSGMGALKRARSKAEEATRSPETYPDAWQVLGETYLRMAGAKGVKEREKEKMVEEGLGAVEKIFGTNPRHGMGRWTQGRLLLRRAKGREGEERRRVAKEAEERMKEAERAEPLFGKRMEGERGEARALSAAP